MGVLSRRSVSIVMAVCAAMSILGVTPVRAAVRTAGKSFQVTATMKGAQNMTVLLVSSKGQTLASAKVTKSNQKITLKTAKVSSTAGATMQMVASSGAASGKGAYYGPVVVGWSGTSSSKASKVTSKLKKSTASTIAVGTVQVKKVTAQQGYAVALAKAKLADTSTGSLAKASKGKPIGVGTSGKTQTVSSGDFTVSIAAVGDPCQPVNTPTCGPDGRELAPPTNQPGQPTQPGQPVQGGVSTASSDETLGGDKDDDGIPNAFDVNDDGDAVVDSADASTPTPQVAVDNGTQACGEVNFRIFTNFKATQPRFAGTINAYGTGGFKATPENIASTITKSMSMVFSPITSVCGSNVTKTYLKGNGAPYAPADYVELKNTCNTGDYQWVIGQGKICGGDQAKQYDFGSAYTFTGTDLPNALHTFTAKVETADGKSYEFTASPGFVFVTHPMLTAWSTDGTNYTTIDYSQSVPGPDGVSLANEPAITVGQSQTLWLKVHRPQRLAIDGETAQFYDLGGFKWTPDIPNGNPSPGKCDAIMTTDTTMTSDQPVDEAVKPQLVLQWQMSKCYGVAPRNAAWQPGGGDFDIQVEPSGPGGNAAQKVRITLS